MPNDIRYEKKLLRQGKRKDLPILDGGELGYTIDTAQLFVGTNPDDAVNVDHNIVTIYPFPNARKVVQGFLDNSSDYTNYIVNEDLTIETESQDKALELIDFINAENAEYFENFTVPISTLEQNVEIITSKNVHDYIHPSDQSVFYDPSTDFSRPSKRLLVKELDSSLGGVFLEYDIDQLFHLKVEYVLVQENGWHRRSGEMSLVSDNNENVSNEVGFVDDQVLYNSAIHQDFIEFSGETIDGKLRVKFSQPTEHTTKIFYRVVRWNIDGIVEGAYDEMPEPDPDQILTVNGDNLDVNGNDLDLD